MNYSGFMGGLYGFAEWIMRFSIINMLWVVMNLPILFIISLMVITPSKVGILVLAIPAVLLFPVLFFPSTIAVFAMVRDWIMKSEQSSLIKTFWLYVKDTYKKSVLSGVIFALLWMVWLVDFNYFSGSSDILGVVLLIIGFILFVYTINYFHLDVHYHMGIKDLLKNAIFITVGSPLLLLAIPICYSLLLYISISKLWFMFPFFIVSVSAFLSFWLFHYFTLKIAEKGK